MKITKDSYFLFSGGEVHAKFDKLDGNIALLDYSMNGLMALAQYVQVVRHHYPDNNFHLTIPYLPYARQDRWMADGEAFSLKIYCDLINSLEFNKVTVWDAHSDVGSGLLNNCEAVPQHELVRLVVPCSILDDSEVLLVSPDAGAYKKISKLTNDDSRIVIGTKQRNENGEIISTNIFSQVPVKGRACLIVDDICDGGKTFIELARILRAEEAHTVLLYVTHGIFSKGFHELSQHIDKIHTTNSFTHGMVAEALVQVTKLC